MDRDQMEATLVLRGWSPVQFADGQFGIMCGGTGLYYQYTTHSVCHDAASCDRAIEHGWIALPYYVLEAFVRHTYGP